MGSAFVTGAASGIGLGVAHAFLEAGMKVAVGYRSEGPLEATLESLAFAGDRVTPIQVDVADRASVGQATHNVVSAFGRTHVLVNNAGVPDAVAISYDWRILRAKNLASGGGTVHAVGLNCSQRHEMSIRSMVSDCPAKGAM